MVSMNVFTEEPLPRHVIATLHEEGPEGSSVRKELHVEDLTHYNPEFDTYESERVFTMKVYHGYRQTDEYLVNEHDAKSFYDEAVRQKTIREGTHKPKAPKTIARPQGYGAW